MQFFCLYGIGLPTERSYYYLNLESDRVSGALQSLPSTKLARQSTLQTPSWGSHASRTYIDACSQ